MKVKELVYMILDLSKASTSDDSFYTEDHVIFLCKKYRAFLIKKEQDKNKEDLTTLSEFETQQMVFDLEKTAAIDGEPCTGSYYLRSTKAVPKIVEGYIPKLYPMDYYQGINISLISRDRMRYVGTNKFLQNIIYASIGPDLHLYLKSSNPQFLYLKNISVSAIFENFDEVTSEDSDSPTDVLESEFPIREYLIPMLIELVVKELVGASYRPQDTVNNANDDLSDIHTWIRHNMKNSLQKQIDA